MSLGELLSKLELATMVTVKGDIRLGDNAVSKLVCISHDVGCDGKDVTGRDIV